MTISSHSWRTGKNSQEDGEGFLRQGASGLGAREVARHTVGVAVLGFLGSAFDGLTAIVTSRALGPHGRGLFAVTLTVAALVAVTASLGVTTAARVALASSPPRVEMGHYLAVAPLHAIAAAAVGMLASGVMVVGLLHTGTWVLAVTAGVVAGGLTLSTFIFDGLHAIGRHRWATGSNAAGSLTALLTSSALAAVGTTSAVTYLLALGLSLLIQVALGLVLLRRATAWTLTFSRAAHQHLLRSGLPALPYLASTLATFRLDRYLVGALAGVGAAGVYSVAATISEATRQLPSALGQVLLFGRASSRIHPSLERKARLLVLCAVAGALFAMGAAAEPIVRGLVGDDFAAAVDPLRILLVGEIFMALWFIDSRMLIGSGRLGAPSATTVLSMAVLAVGDLVLVPPFGIRGAAMASVLAYGAAAGTASYFLRSGSRDGMTSECKAGGQA